MDSLNAISDVGDTRLREDIFAADCRDLGIVVGEGPGHHVHPEIQRAGFLADLSKANGVDSRPLDGNRIKIFMDLLTQFAPHGCYGVFADRPGLHGHALRLGADGPRPGVPRVVDRDGVG